MTYLLDTSVITRLRLPAVRAAVDDLQDQGLRCTSLTVLEVGFSARNGEEWDRLVDAVRSIGTVDVGEGALGDAARTQRSLAARGLRGRKVPDLVIAAVAAAEGLTVLHYDADLEHIAAVTGQLQRWVVPAGSVD